MKRIGLLIITVMLLIVGCMFRPQPDRSTIVLASVNGKPVTAIQLDSVVENSNIVIRDTTDVKSLKEALLDSLIDQELIEIRVDSVVLELEHDREFLDKLKEELTRTVLQLMYEGEIVTRINIDSSEIIEHYNQNPDQYKDPEQVKASHILVKIPPPDTFDVNSQEKMDKIFENNKKETLERAEAILARALKGENWDSLVVKYSHDMTNNKKGGDLGYFASGMMVPEFDSAAFAAAIGDIVGPVETRFGFHIIKIIDHKPDSLLALNDELFTSIKASLSQVKEKEKADSFVDSLKSTGKFIYNEEILQQPDSLLDPYDWVMIVNDVDTVFEKVLQKNFYKYLRYNQITDWTADDKKNMLNEMAVNSLLRSAGKILGYYEKPRAIEARNDINRREAILRVKSMLRELEYQPSVEEIEEYYNEHFSDMYREKKPLHVQHIIFEDSIAASVIRDSIQAGSDFKEMALKYYPGEKEIREVAYDLGFISDEELGPKFFAVADLLQEGDVSIPFKTEWGYHIIKLVDRRADKKLDQVRPGIRRALIEAANAEVKRRNLDEWHSIAEVVENTKALEKYDFPESVYSVEITPDK